MTNDKSNMVHVVHNNQPWEFSKRKPNQSDWLAVLQNNSRNVATHQIQRHCCHWKEFTRELIPRNTIQQPQLARREQHKNKKYSRELELVVNKQPAILQSKQTSSNSNKKKEASQPKNKATPLLTLPRPHRDSADTLGAARHSNIRFSITLLVSLRNCKLVGRSNQQAVLLKAESHPSITHTQHHHTHTSISRESDTQDSKIQNIPVVLKYCINSK